MHYDTILPLSTRVVKPETNDGRNRNTIFLTFGHFFFYRAASNQNLSSFFFFFFLFPKDLRIRQLRLTSVLTLCLLPSKILRTRLSQVASDLTLSLSFSKP